MRFSFSLLGLATTLLLFTGACSSDDPNAATSSDSATSGQPSGSGSGSSGSGGDGSGGAAPMGCTTPTEVPCLDQVYQAMNLKVDPVTSLISSQPDGAGWISNIDATAGGAFNPDPTSFTYARFGDAGLEKVDIGDEASQDWMDWDIAFRRYVVRINSGHSGPSCVVAARVPPNTTYEALTAVPEGLNYRRDDYFTESCEIIPDGSGLENSPATALSGYWSYPGCVKMTGNVFVIQLASGKRVKFIVDGFYLPAVQETCQACTMNCMLPQGETGSGNFTVRWAMLQ